MNTTPTATLFAVACAERVLPIYEAAYPGDGRPRRAIAAARAIARGEMAPDEAIPVFAEAVNAAKYARGWRAQFAAMAAHLSIGNLCGCNISAEFYAEWTAESAARAVWHSVFDGDPPFAVT